MRGLVIGGLALASPLVLAPMAGITDLPLRRLARSHGCALTFTEMLKDCSLVRGNAGAAAILARSEADRPIGVQLLGSEPGALAAAARIAEDRGADLIDLNLGCPAPRVMRNGEGAALLREPDRVARLVEALVGAVKVPVTVKLRLGVARGEETAAEVARLAEAAGASAVTVHGRFASELYTGKADWHAIARVGAAVTIPMIGNGDVRSGPDARRMFATAACEGIMIGRGALGRPWIFREILACLEGRDPAPVTPAEKLTVALEHLAGLTDLYGPRQGVLVMRKHAGWYVRGMPGAARRRARLFRAVTAEAMEDLLREALGEGNGEDGPDSHR